MFNTRSNIFSDVQPPISKLRERGTARFFERLQSDWTSDGTVCQVLYTSFQIIKYSPRNAKLKFMVIEKVLSKFFKDLFLYLFYSNNSFVIFMN